MVKRFLTHHLSRRRTRLVSNRWQNFLAEAGKLPRIGTGQRVGLLMIHGFLGCPEEFDPVRALCATVDVETMAVSQPGHGANLHQPLGSLGADHIFENAMARYEEFAGRVDEIYVVGHSLGGASALWLAGQQLPKLSGAIAISAPYEHAYWVNQPNAFFKLPSHILMNGLGYLTESFMGFDRPKLYPWWFGKLYKETSRLFGAMQSALPEIRVPVMLAHAQYDLAVPYAEMPKLASALQAAPLVETVTLHNCGHQVFPHSREAPTMAHRMLEFIGEAAQKKYPIRQEA